MTTVDETAYCPFAYGYSNYVRPGYAARALAFHDTAALEPFGRLRTTLGGTGLARFDRCRETEAAVKYAVYVASGVCQSTVYVENGGHPGLRLAWLNDRANELSSDSSVPRCLHWNAPFCGRVMTGTCTFRIGRAPLCRDFCGKEVPRRPHCMN